MTAIDQGYGAPPVTPPVPKPAPTITFHPPPGYAMLPSAAPGSPTLDASALAKESDPNVRALVMGNFDPMLMRKWKPDDIAAVLKKAQQYDPNIDMSNYPTKVAAKRAFTSGKAADAIRSINQFVGHINSLSDAEAALNNTDGWFPTPTNWVANTVGAQFSPDLRERIGKFEPLRSAVGNEFENMMRGSSVSGVQERLAQLRELSPNTAPSSIKGWTKGALEVMQSRLNELNDQYKQGTGLQYGFDALNPQSKMILRRFGINPEGAAPATGGAAATAGGGQYQIEKSNPSKVLINDPRIDKFMQDNHITDKGQAIRILQQRGIIQ